MAWRRLGGWRRDPRPPPPPPRRTPEDLAQELLLSLLSRPEKAQFARDGYLRVAATSRWWWGPRRVYHIVVRGGEAILFRRLFFRVLQRGCVYAAPSWRYPTSDEIIALYLALKANEPYVRRVANWL